MKYIAGNQIDCGMRFGQMLFEQRPGIAHKSVAEWATELRLYTEIERLLRMLLGPVCGTQLVQIAACLVAARACVFKGFLQAIYI